MLILNVSLCSILLWVLTKAQEIPESFLSIENMSLPLRIQRDIAMNITIDQWIWPALDMSTAFFGNDYSPNKFSDINQPLWMGYKRLIIDIYWNPPHWQLCPLDLLNCTFTFDQYIQSIHHYLVSTQVTVEPTQTNLITLILNLHHNTTTTANTITTELSSIILNTLSPQIIYTPSNFTLDSQNTTLPYSVDWPPWLFIIRQQVQLLIGFGTIQEGIRISTSDSSLIFSQGAIGQTIHNEPYSCPPKESTQWPFLQVNEYNTSLNNVSCGYSPYFTKAYNDTNHILSTIWSWDLNQPDSEGGTKRCAVIQHGGRWMTNDCAESLRVACRLVTDEDQWVLTKSAYNYDRSLTACPSNYIFDIPRIPRQNLRLIQAIKDANITDDKVWLNLNLLYNEDDCWVIGRYGTCWWSINSQLEFLGLIKTSIVAGVIILLLVSIFTWVKCARLWRNRNSKARKAMVKAMLARREYVTVPVKREQDVLTFI